MHALWETRSALEIDAAYVGGGLAFVPDDPHHVNGNQWYHEAGSDIDLDATSAWDITTGSSDVTVAVVDTGTKGLHPEFSGRFFVNTGEVPGNGIDDDQNLYVDDVSGWNTSVGSFGNGDVEDTTVGHGTYVASILMATADNTHQVAGFDHHVKYLPIKSQNSSSGVAYRLQAALEYLIMNPGFAQVVNVSLAGFTETRGLGNALTGLAETTIIVGGSGNDGLVDGADDGYPESHPAVITVAGTDATDAHAWFSDGGNSVEFAAPAVGIYTASWADPFGQTASHVEDGTSLATPMVSGIATLGLSIRPAMSRSDLLFALRASAVDLGAPGWDTDFGWGRVNARDALEYLQRLIFTDDFEKGDIAAWD